MRLNTLALVLRLATSLLACLQAFWRGEAGGGINAWLLALLLGFVICLILFLLLQHELPQLNIEQSAGDCVNRLLERRMLFAAEFYNVILQPPVSAKS